MSFDLIWNAPEGTFRSSTHLLVALTICRHTRVDGVCYAYLRTLAKRAYLHKKTISRVVAELAEDKIIEIEHTPGENGGNGANRIIMCMHGVVDSKGTGDDLEPHVAEQDNALHPRRARLPRKTRTPYAGDSDPSPPRTPRVSADDGGNRDNGTLNETSNETQSHDAGASTQSQPNGIPDVERAFHLWNDLAERCGLPTAEKLTNERRRKIFKRLTENDGIATWKRALASVEVSKFLRGLVPGKDGAAPFKANLDFLLQAKSFQKTIEGAYGQDAPPPGKREMSKAEYIEKIRKHLREDQNFAWVQCARWRTDGQWDQDMGPAPTQEGCLVPVYMQLQLYQSLPEDDPRAKAGLDMLEAIRMRERSDREADDEVLS